MRGSILLLPLLLLGACASDDDVKTVASQNTYTINVAHEPDGAYKALAPKCATWDDATIHRLRNDPLPQLGCATQGNLAKMIADPRDLVRDQLPPEQQPAAVGADGTNLATGVQRYHENHVYEPATGVSSGSGGN